MTSKSYINTILIEDIIIITIREGDVEKMEQVWAFDATKNNRKSIEKYLKEEFYEKMDGQKDKSIFCTRK